MNQFEKFYTEDLETVTLQGVTFHFKIPGKDNKRFQRSVIARIAQIDPTSGELIGREVSIEQMAEAQIDAFARTCIRQVDGWDDYTVDKLLALVDACEDLWAEAVALTKSREDLAAAATKKSASSLPGRESGPDGMSSMPSCQSAAI